MGIMGRLLYGYILVGYMLGSLETLHVTGKLLIHRAPAHKVDHTSSSNLSGSLWACIYQGKGRAR